MVLAAPIGIEVERKAFTRGDEDSVLGYVEVWRVFGASRGEGE